MKKITSKLPAVLLTLVVGVMASSSALGQANLVILNTDPAGVGFNDNTPATPVGGNDGTTIGSQRIKAFERAASIWGGTLPGGPTITVRARWDSNLNCEATTGTLGSAGSTSIHRDFPGAAFANTWYGAALANTLAGVDLNPSTPEISAQFNPRIGTAANPDGTGACLPNSHWYYGFDNVHVGGRINLVTVLLHEFAHGLGFQTFTSSSTGMQASGQNGQPSPSVYDRFLLDKTTNKTWIEMTPDERKASAIGSNLVWNGTRVIEHSPLIAPQFSAGRDAQGRLLMHAPDPVEGGSSVSHWSTFATPNQLMEPKITAGLFHSVRPPDDLTFSLLTDIGWCASNCPPPPPPPSPTPTPSPPANDNFANAQVLTGCSPTATGTNVGATKEPGELIHLLESAQSARSVWYQWQAPVSGTATISTAGSTFDTILAVYTGNSVNALGLVARNDDVSGTNTSSIVTFTATAGVNYRIAVEGFNNQGSGGDVGNISLAVNLSNCSTIGPTLLTEGGTNNALVMDSVTLLRGPFPIIAQHNFSSDRRTRVLVFVSNFAVGPGDTFSVQAHDASLNTYNLPVETFAIEFQSMARYLVVKLTDELPAGALDLSVTLRGAQSNKAKITIIK